MKSGSFVDTRQSLRVPKADQVRFAIASEDHQVKHKAFTMNRSPHGVGIRTRVQLSPGEVILIFPQKGSWHTIPARVAWVRGPISSAGYIAGLEFLSLSAP
jgi:hypothetical protein